MLVNHAVCQNDAATELPTLQVLVIDDFTNSGSTLFGAVTLVRSTAAAQVSSSGLRASNLL